MTDHKVGDVVTCVHARGYALTEGKEYTVVDVWPSFYCPDSRFTFPSYVVVAGDDGREKMCHHYRFK